MTPPDFAAARERVLARQQTASDLRASQHAQQRAAHAAHPISKLPFPVGQAAKQGLQLWDKIAGVGGTKPLWRVGQLDAEILDEELLELLRGRVGDGLKYFGVGSAQHEARGAVQGE